MVILSNHPPAPATPSDPRLVRKTQPVGSNQFVRSVELCHVPIIAGAEAVTLILYHKTTPS